MIKYESFDYFGNIPILEKGGRKFINLLGKNLVVDNFFYPSDENHVAFYDSRACEVFVRVNSGLIFPFPPKMDFVMFIVTPDIKRCLKRNDLVVPIDIYTISEDAYEAIALI